MSRAALAFGPAKRPAYSRVAPKKIRPEVRLLIDEALAKRRENSCGT
jgi:hypothetical protein